MTEDICSKLRKEAVKRGAIRDDFNEKSPYWNWRIDNYAGFEVKDSILRIWMGPSEALYYSNAEISDGKFDDLPWSKKTFEAKIRFEGTHYGSAGWGFWNHTMVIDTCIPIWFIYLRARGSYPLQGFFVQAKNIFQPIILFEKNRLFKAAYYLSKISEKFIGIKIISLNPVMQDLDLSKWHIYKVEWKNLAKFYIDEKLVATIPLSEENVKARADIWLDNAVFMLDKKDAGRVYRHVTQENRKRTFLEVDYVAVY